MHNARTQHTYSSIADTPSMHTHHTATRSQTYSYSDVLHGRLPTLSHTSALLYHSVASDGHTALAKYVKFRDTEKRIKKGPEIAARIGDLELLKWMVEEQNLRVKKESILAAAQSGANCVEFLADE